MILVNLGNGNVVERGNICGFKLTLSGGVYSVAVNLYAGTQVVLDGTFPNRAEADAAINRIAAGACF